MIENYDPNIRWTRHTYAITLQMWDYRLTLEAGINGNCRGFTTMGGALSSLADKLYEEQGEFPVLILARPGKGADPTDELECDCDCNDIEDWLQSMCVGIELVKHTEEKR